MSTPPAAPGPSVPAAAPAAATPAPAPAPAAAPAKKPKNKTWATVSPFVLGGASGMIATSIIQPMDMIKVRIQLAGEGAKGKAASPFAVAGQLIKNEGFFALYKGLSAGLLRQATYTTARLGLFRSISDYLQEKNGPGALPFWQKSVAGLAAGGLAAVFGTPADVSLIRMQADATLPLEQRRNYTGVVNALTRITREEGMKGLFAGNTPVVIRAMALNMGMLSTHDQALEQLKQLTSNRLAADVGAKFIAGFFASFLSLPFDFVKTRMQKQKPGPDGKLPYANVASAFAKILAAEGPGSFYRGFLTYYFRIAPHAMLTLWANDFLKDATKEW